MKKLAGYLLIGVFLAVLVVAGYQLYKIWDTYHAADEEYKELKQIAELPDQDPVRENPGGQGKEGEREKKREETINFERLKQINPDIVAWLRIEAAGIDYPVVQGTDNEHYLHYTFRGEASIAGSIFMDYRNTPDFSDEKVILYGHNMRDGSMFAKLKKLDVKEEPVAIIYTPEGEFQFQLNKEDYVSATDEIYLVDKLLVREQQDNYTGDKREKTLVLSTCSSVQSTRHVILGKAVNL